MAPLKRNPRAARGPRSAIRKPHSVVRNPKSAIRNLKPPRSRQPRSLAASIGPNDVVKSMIERLDAQAATFGLIDPLDVEPALEYDPDPRQVK